VLDVEQSGNLTAHPLAVIDADAPFPQGRLIPFDPTVAADEDGALVLGLAAAGAIPRPRTVDEDAQEPVSPARDVFELDQLVPQPLQERLYEGDQSPAQDRRHRTPTLQKRKWAVRPIRNRPSPRSGSTAGSCSPGQGPLGHLQIHPQKRKAPRG